MLVFAGMENDAAAERAAKLRALQDYFAESNATALEMLAPNALSKENANRGKQLIINSHADVNHFAGMNAKSLYEKLVSKGLENGAFQSLYLIACEAGQRNRKGVIVGNFAHDLNSVFKQNQVDIALYAPRGAVTYAVQTFTQDGVSNCEVANIMIHSPERDYPLSRGMLRVII